MGKRDDLIAKYADDLKNKCKISPDMALLTKVTIGCGPSIYDNDAQTVAASDKDELERIQRRELPAAAVGAEGSAPQKPSARCWSSSIRLSRFA